MAIDLKYENGNLILKTKNGKSITKKCRYDNSSRFMLALSQGMFDGIGYNKEKNQLEFKDPDKSGTYIYKLKSNDQFTQYFLDEFKLPSKGSSTEKQYDFSAFKGFYYSDEDERSYYSILYITDKGQVIRLSNINSKIDPNSSNPDYLYELTEDVIEEALNGESEWESVSYSEYGSLNALMLSDSDKDDFTNYIKDYYISLYSNTIPEDYIKYIKPITYAPSWNNTFAEEFVVKVDITSDGYSRFPDILESRTDINGNTFTPDKDHAYLVKNGYYTQWYFYNGSELVTKSNTYKGLDASSDNVYTLFDIVNGQVKYTGVKYYNLSSSGREGDIDEFTFGPATTDELANYAYYTECCSYSIGYDIVRAINNANPKVFISMPAFPRNEGIGVAFYSDNYYEDHECIDLNGHKLVPMYNPNDYSIRIIDDDISESHLINSNKWIFATGYAAGYLKFNQNHTGIFCLSGTTIDYTWNIVNNRLEMTAIDDGSLEDIGMSGIEFYIKYDSLNDIINLGLGFQGQLQISVQCRDTDPVVFLGSSNDSYIYKIPTPSSNALVEFEGDECVLVEEVDGSGRVVQPSIKGIVIDSNSINLVSSPIKDELNINDWILMTDTEIDLDNNLLYLVDSDENPIRIIHVS